MSNPRSNSRNNPRTTPRSAQVIEPLLRLQQLEQRRSPLPPPNPGARPAPPRQAAAPRPTDAPRPTSLPAAGGVSAEANARLAALQARNGAPGRPGSRPAGKKGKPAQGAKVASLVLSALATGGLAAMFAQNSQAQGDSIVLTGGTAATLATTPTTATTGTTAVGTGVITAATTATTAAATTGQILDGTYVGEANNNRWGTVQVQAVYSGGQLVDVQILSYPDGDGRSVRINQYALPTLISEAVSAQSADVNTVSGATYTSKSYRASLQSAIDAAKAASGLA